MKQKNDGSVGIFLFSTLCLNVGAIDHKGITFDRLAPYWQNSMQAWEI